MVLARVLVTLMIVSGATEGEALRFVPGWWLVSKTPNPTITTAAVAAALGVYVAFFAGKDWLERRRRS